MPSPLLRSASALALAAAFAPALARAAEEPPPVSQVVVTAARTPAPGTPDTVESVTAERLALTTNVVTPQDALRYLPDIFVRERHFGDTQAPLTTRTSGVGASARSLVFADGVLLSALIGNNNSNASPRWGLVPAEAISRVDVLYGPFDAQYAGNSIGAVVNITTRTPDRFEAHAELQGAVQSFRLYGDRDTLGTGRAAASVGDRFGPLALRVSYNHLESDAQPLSYAVSPAPSATPLAGAVPVTGAIPGASRAGAPLLYLGSTASEHQAQDVLSARVSYDLSSTLTAAYTVGLFRNEDDAGVASYLRDPSGAPVYAGRVAIDRRSYTLAPSTFSGGVYHMEEDLLAQGLSLASHTGGAWDFEVVGSRFDYLKSRQRIPAGALPAAFDGGPGSTTSLDDTGWATLDAKATWRPLGADGAHVLAFGAHADAFKLNNPRYALADWINGSAGPTLAFSRGRTETQALWLQNVWRVAPALTATLGGRWEHWDAYDGLNFSASPALNRAQPAEGAWRFSPKGVLALAPGGGWTFSGSLGVAYRFPTVTELYQAVTAGTILSVPNPDLRPENALSGELSAERRWADGRVRLSLFGERILDALISQAGLLPNQQGALTTVNFVQNIDAVRTRGVELVASQDHVLIPGLRLDGWITYVDGRIAADAAAPALVGKRLPQLPPLRGAAVATWTASPRLSLTLAARYGDRSHGAIDDSEFANTYQGFGAYFVADAHVRWRIAPHLTGEVGVDNLGDRSYFAFHPFPQRTVIADIAYAY